LIRGGLPAVLLIRTLEATGSRGGAAMIWQANDEIRARAEAAEERRRLEASTRRPLVYLDWLIVQLEEFHVAGKKRVPRAFEAQLEAVADLLPPGV